jgi:hypothetical protein
MMPRIGQHVKCVLRTGAIAEGIVNEWGNSVELKSLDGESILILPHANDDIMLIKIILKKDIIKEIPKLNNLEEEMVDAYNQPSNDLRIKKIAELKILMAEQEKKIIADKLKSHSIDSIKKVEYGTPKFFKVNGSK